MRTGLFLLAGFLLLGVSTIVARLFSQFYPSAGAWSTGVFIAMWFAFATFNMWVGVSKAGYSVAAELPVFVLLLGIPVAAAIFIKWKFL
jgi:hypothetical protein